MRNLHVYCDGGFGNRLNGLVAGLLLAKAAGMHPIIVWPCNNWCGARFFDVFDRNKLSVLERELVSYVPDQAKFQFFMTEDHLGMGVSNFSPLGAASVAETLEYLKSDSRDVFFHSPLIPSYFAAADVDEVLHSLSFSGEIRRRAKEFMESSGLGDLFYGLQIRKTDFGSHGANDDALFELVRNSVTKKFFVCSDNKDVEFRFKGLPNVRVYEKSAYVEKLVPGEWTALAADHSGRVYPCNVNRNAQSVIDAVVDLIVLSYSEIIKTSGSTFLNAAILLKSARKSFTGSGLSDRKSTSSDKSNLYRMEPDVESTPRIALRPFSDVMVNFGSLR
jgi:hypothetical protein